MIAKVIPIGQQNRPMLNLSLDELVGFEGVKLLAKLIQQWHKEDTSRKLKDLAQKAQLTPTTVSRIMNRETRMHRMLTCIMLFKALGFTAVRLA